MVHTPPVILTVASTTAKDLSLVPQTISQRADVKLLVAGGFIRTAFCSLTRQVMLTVRRTKRKRR